MLVDMMGTLLVVMRMLAILGRLGPDMRDAAAFQCILNFGQSPDSKLEVLLDRQNYINSATVATDVYWFVWGV
jgi:hypothetical protein